MVIYKTTNLINGKFYIGKTVKNKISYLGSGIRLKEAILKYGRQNFKKEIIETCDNLETLNEREIYWIKELKSMDRSIGYNLSKGGDGGDLISYNTKRNEIIKNIRNGVKAYRNNPLNAEKISRDQSKANDPLRMNEMSKNGVFSFNKGRKFDKGTREKMSSGKKKIYADPNYKHYKSKEVYQYDKDFILIKKWKNYSEIIEIYGQYAIRLLNNKYLDSSQILYESYWTTLPYER
jgi:hypothetical protein